MNIAKGAAAVLLLPALVASAHAEPRRTSISVGGWFGGTTPMAVPVSEGRPEFTSFAGMVATLGWEPAAIGFPAGPGYAVDVALVPEVFAGVLDHDARAEGLLGVGVRAEVRMAQHQMGRFGVSAHGSLYLAGRAAIMGDDQQPTYAGVLGTYVSPGASRLRLGIEGGVMAFDRPDLGNDQNQFGPIVSLYLGKLL